MSEHASSRHRQFARLTLLLATTWVAAGALFKLFAGSPNDLPPLVKEFFLGPVQTFRSAIAIELCIVILAILRPRFAWLPLAALFGVFIAVLLPLALSDAESCGCFGSSVTIPPKVMIAIDGTLLALMLAGRPWSAFGSRGLRPIPLVPLFAVAIAAPWLMFRTPELKLPSAKKPPQQVAENTDVEGSAAETTPATPAEAPGAAPDPVVYQGWQLPDPLPQFHWFETDDWTGKAVHEIDLSLFVDPDLLPPDCEVVFYRQTCDHCKEHLEKLTMEPPLLPLVLLRVAEIGDTPENEVTVIKPEGHIPLELPAIERGYGLETPSRLMLEGFVVQSFEVIEHEEH